MFEHLFEKRLVSAIGAKVVDDTKYFTVSVYVPPPPAEGKARITEVTAPSEFTPDVPFYVKVRLVNDGGDDKLFFRLINSDTGTILREIINPFITITGGGWTISSKITLTQTTDFHGRAEAGHTE